jgi:fatty-acyl-CoA synthase
VALADPELKEQCPPLSSGLVLVSGPQVFPGYVDPQHDKGVLTDDRWIVTGDVGYLTEDQRLVLTGREKDLIVRSGHNIDPAAIEDVANAFPGVQISSAVGMPDAYAGEVPILFVVPSPGSTIDLPLLREHLERNVNEPPAKPKRVVLLEALPVTAVGKIFKPTLRDLAVREKVRAEIDRVFGPETAADILVEKDARLNTLVHIRVNSDDQTRAKALAESLATLPQTYRIETRSS